MHGDAEQEVASHPFPPAFLCCVCLPFNQCQRASHYKLYSQPPCIVLNLSFWFLPRISQSLGFESVTDVLPASAIRCTGSSACHQLEKELVRIMYLCWTLQQVSAMRCVPAAQRETAILNLADESCSDEEVLLDCQDSRGLTETCKHRDWQIRDPIWRKSDKIGEKVNFVGEKKYLWRTSGSGSMCLFS